MKAQTVATIVAVASAPVVTALGVDWLGIADIDRVMGGEDVRDVAQEIAEREFTPRVTLQIIDVRDEPTTKGEWGETYRPDAGKTYRTVTIGVLNEGRLDVSLHTWHFSIETDDRLTRKAELGLATKFEHNGLRQGESAAGEVVFHVAEGTSIVALRWQGEIANSTLQLGTPVAPAADAEPRHGPLAEPPSEPQEKPDP